MLRFGNGVLRLRSADALLGFASLRMTRGHALRVTVDVMVLPLIVKVVSVFSVTPPARDESSSRKTTVLPCAVLLVTLT